MSPVANAIARRNEKYTLFARPCATFSILFGVFFFGRRPRLDIASGVEPGIWNDQFVTANVLGLWSVLTCFLVPVS